MDTLQYERQEPRRPRERNWQAPQWLIKLSILALSLLFLLSLGVIVCFFVLVMDATFKQLFR